MAEDRKLMTMTPAVMASIEHLAARMAFVFARPVPKTEAVRRAVALAMSASDEDLVKGEL